ncbi:MAG: YHS domain-containing (seleno)protein [Pseudomonadota bacterium]
MTFKNPLSAALLALFISVAPAAHAADEYNVSVGVTAAGAPLGLHGVDPVAMIRTGEQVEGSAAHTAVHDGVAYYFASDATKAAFEADPQSFLPQYGGFCTFGVSVGKKFDGDPSYAAVIDGALYVFLNEEIFAAFQKDRDGTLARAAAQWPEIRSTAVSDL